MIYENERCRVEIKIDDTYTIGSVDNHHYDVVHNPDSYLRGDHSRTISLAIQTEGHEIRVALIGSFLTFTDDCAILEGEELVILQWDRVIRLRAVDGTILRCSKLDVMGGGLGIYPVGEGYLLHGEMDIIMLDHDLEERWSFSGRDIFASVTGKESFAIGDGIIKLYDFEDNYYELDFDGNLIRMIAGN